LNLKIIALLPLFSLLAVVPPASADDIYLTMIHENGEVIACTDTESFTHLLSGEQIEDLAQLCRPTLVPDSSEPKFIGWAFLDPPVWVDGTDAFVVARKYVMDTDAGEVRFAWPYPLEMSQYAAFGGPYEEKQDSVPVASPPLAPDLFTREGIAITYASY
jgi:hypothetical protein